MTLAKREFERLERIPHWRLHAKTLECHADDERVEHPARPKGA